MCTGYMQTSHFFYKRDWSTHWGCPGTNPLGMWTPRSNSTSCMEGVSWWGRQGLERGKRGSRILMLPHGEPRRHARWNRPETKEKSCDSTQCSTYSSQIHRDGKWNGHGRDREQVVAGAGSCRVVNGYGRVSRWNEFQLAVVKSSEMDSGDGGTTVWLCYIPLNYTLENGWDGNV